MDEIETILLLVFIFLAPYCALITVFIIGWLRLPDYKQTEDRPGAMVSLVIAVRNEINNLRSLEACLSVIDYPQDKLEIILVDDHSDDGSLDIMKQFDLCNLKVFSLPQNEEGKKAAIAMGVTYSEGDVVLCTDADCSFKPQWVQTMVSYYIEKSPDIVFGGVNYSKTNTVWQQLMALEFSSLVACGAGAAGFGSAIYNNAANVLYRGGFIRENLQWMEKNIASGDDVLFLQNAKKENGVKIDYIKSDDVWVTTDPPENFSAFLSQRIRWASKGRNYTDILAKVTGYVVFFTNLLLLSFLVLAIGFPPISIWFFIGFIVKITFDFVILSLYLISCNRFSLMKWFVLVELGYVIYAPVVGLMSRFLKYKWKGRKY